MHDVGDLLVASGFAQPVIDMEKLTLTYSSVEAVLREIRQSGQVNVAASRPRGLGGRHAWSRWREAIERSRRDGRIAITVELVFGHAWKPERARAEGIAPIRFHR
jgi:malonyl-CoA O-methyltransferase